MATNPTYDVGGTQYRAGKPVTRPVQPVPGAQGISGSTGAGDFQLPITGPDVIYGYGQGTNPDGTWTGGGTDGGGGGGGETKSWEQLQAEADTRRRKELTRDAVKAAFSLYGLGSLYPLIEEWAQQGLSEDAIYLQLRGTAEYKARFPAMEALSAKGRAITESQYVQYETTVAQLEQKYGYPKGMLTGQVTNMLTNDLSVVEVEERATLAAADSITAPDDLKQQLRDYYGVDPDQALKAYYLDPEIAMPILQKQSAAARIGVQATRQGLSDVGVGLAEELQALGVTEDQAKSGFATTAYQSGLAAGKGDTVDQDARIAAILKGDAGAIKDVTRAKESRTQRFEGGGGYVQSKSGVEGLASSSA